MLRTILFFFILWLSLIISLIMLIPIWLFELLQLSITRNKFVRAITWFWSGIMLFTTGVKIKKINMPEYINSNKYAIVSNHQGNFDILVILRTLPVTPAFISKIELKNTPLLSTWMKAMDCLFIDRSDSAGSRQKILKRLQETDRNPLLLFPEGTRSRREKLLSVRTGGLKMIYDSRTDVLPIRISGSYKIWEENKRIKPGAINIDVKPFLEADDYSKQSFEIFVKRIKELMGP